MRSSSPCSRTSGAAPGARGSGLSDRVALLTEGPIPSAIGSLPHTDPDAAARLILDAHPDLPAAPQLPNRSPRELMVAQVDAPLDGEGWSGLSAFLAATAGRRPPVKLQVCGPVTYATYAACDLDTAVERVGRQASALVATTRCPTVMFLDEPALATDVPFGRDEVLAALRATVRPGWGIHCCGETDVELLTHTGAAVLSLPAPVAAVAVPAVFLEEGGWVAWGIEAEGELRAAWAVARERGVDAVRLRRQALVTPVCGLAGCSEAEAEAALRMVAHVAGSVAGDDDV